MLFWFDRIFWLCYTITVTLIISRSQFNAIITIMMHYSRNQIDVIFYRCMYTSRINVQPLVGFHPTCDNISHVSLKLFVLYKLKSLFLVITFCTNLNLIYKSNWIWKTVYNTEFDICCDTLKNGTYIKIVHKEMFARILFTKKRLILNSHKHEMSFTEGSSCCF